MGVAQPRYSALFQPSRDAIKTALVFPWNTGVGIEGVFLPPPLYFARTADQLFGAIISPSTSLPFRLLGQLVCGAYSTPGTPLLLRAQLSTTVHLLSLPLPSCNMFLSLLVSATASPPYLWLLLSAAAEFVVASGLQPPPRSACLGSLLHFTDWADLRTAPFFPAAAPPSGAPPPFLLRSGFLSYGMYGRWMSSSQPVLAGTTRLQMGPCGYNDDIWFLSTRPLPLYLLLAFHEPPHGSAHDSALAPGLFMDLLDLFTLSIAVFLALPADDEDEDYDF